MRAGATYVDFNSITGDMMVEAAEILSGQSIQVVDGGVRGNFEGGNAVPVLLVGEGAQAVAELLPSSHFLSQVAPGRPGDASAIKMLRSVLMKGLEALCVECLLASESQGLTPLLLKAFDDLDSRPFVKTMEVLTRTHLIHAGRRMKEVERVAQVLEKQGIDDVMTQATLSLFQKTLAGKIVPDFGRDLSASLAALAPYHRRKSEEER
jgi:3-hydroxyisobutyrate dehydrogenase-like beta-hydroxyacid dehydrogenase